MKKLNSTLLSALAFCILLTSCTEDEPALDITDVKFTSTSIEVTEGTSVNLDDFFEVTGTDADQAQVTFTSSDPTVVSVDGTTLTAEKVGTTKVTATESNSNLTASADVTVITKVVAVTGVTLDVETADLKVGATLQLTATVAPEDATEKGLTWSVEFPPESRSAEDSPTDMATVSEDGLVTGVSAGNVVVVVKTTDGEFTASTDISVTNVAVSSISISPDPIEIQGTSSVQLTATIAPENATNQQVTWSVEFGDVGDGARTNFTLIPENFATIDETGLVTGVSTCNACVRAVATVQDGENTVTTKADINIVHVAVTSITLDPSSFTIDIDATQQMTPTILPENASDKRISWSLAYETNLCDVPPVSNYATIDANGLVTGIAGFEACGGINVIATAENGDGISTKSNFTVNPILATGIEIYIDGQTITNKKIDLLNGTSVTLLVNFTPTNTSDKTLVWTVTDTNGDPTMYPAVSVDGGVVTTLLNDESRVTVTNSASGQTDYIDINVFVL